MIFTYVIVRVDRDGNENYVAGDTDLEKVLAEIGRLVRFCAREAESCIGWIPPSFRVDTVPALQEPSV